MDTRGHGLSDAPDGAYALETLCTDAAAMLDHLELTNFIVVGVSLGGMIAQQLAWTRATHINSIVLSNTAARMGTADMWARIAAIENDGLTAVSNAILARWSTSLFLQSEEVGQWRNMLEHTPAIGYRGCCSALTAADLSPMTADITCPALVISCSLDAASPPESVHTLATALPNASYVEIEGVGHLPMVKAPARFSNLLKNFLEDTPCV